MSDERKTNIHIGCGCLTEIIAIFLLIILCDLLGCSWCHGFTDKVKNVFKTDNQTHQIHPSDLR